MLFGGLWMKLVVSGRYTVQKWRRNKALDDLQRVPHVWLKSKESRRKKAGLGENKVLRKPQYLVIAGIKVHARSTEYGVWIASTGMGSPIMGRLAGVSGLSWFGVLEGL